MLVKKISKLKCGSLSTNIQRMLQGRSKCVHLNSTMLPPEVRISAATIVQTIHLSKLDLKPIKSVIKLGRETGRALKVFHLSKLHRNKRPGFMKTSTLQEGEE